jgi:DNA-binding NarL/FixJ family response regulator
VARERVSPYDAPDAWPSRGEAVIRVVIAGPTTRIVDDLDKLEPHREAIDVCGIAREASEILDEARLRQPDVLLLHDGLTELLPAEVAAQIEPLSPATRVLLVTSRGDPQTGTEFATAVDLEADGQQLADAIAAAVEHAPAGAAGGADADPESPVQTEEPTTRRVPIYRRRFSLGRR